MIAAPILSRELFYYKVRGGTFTLLDWALVNTNVGACVEPVNLSMVPIGASITARNLIDGSFTRITEIDDDQVWRLMRTSGTQLPVSFTQ